MLTELMTVADFYNYFLYARGRAANPYENYVWTEKETDYLRTIVAIGSSCGKPDLVFRGDGSIWMKVESEKLTTNERTQLYNIPADSHADGSRVIDGLQIRVALIPFLLLDKRMRWVGCLMHENELCDTANLLEEPDIQSISFPKYFLFRRHLKLYSRSGPKEANHYAQPQYLDGVTLPELRDTGNPWRTEFARRSRNRYIYRLKANSPDFDRPKIDERILNLLATKTNSYWWIAEEFEMQAIQNMKLSGILPPDPEMVCIPIT